ncbi:biorientation of chromosomes in cell division protein 1-like 1 isoform X2 [Scyliorhinus canicula]|nr:biorientation of chromosomes in cell division protein 1-like 1 isoform X2 [Scyliorhinus canicula]
MVLQSGMLEVGVDRIISQVVDPKINHIFRPQVEKAVHEFLATLDRKEEPAAVSFVPNSEKSEPTTPGLSSSGPSTSKANDALSILDTITSLNQEASAARSTVENSYSKNGEKSSKKTLGLELKCQQSFDLGMEKDRSTEEAEKHVLEAKADDEKLYTKIEGSVNLLTPVKDFEENDEKTENAEECVEDMNALKDNIDQMDKKDVVLRKDEHSGLSKEERRGQGKEWESAKSVTAILTIKQKAKENLKKEYSLEDSDFEGLSDITVSSVHTSDLSSFDVDDDEEEGEVPESDSNEEEQKQSSEEKDTKLETNEEQKEGRVKPGRHPYIHKPFLYSKYYSDSDDEETVVQRRQSIAKEKAERLLRRQWNREKVAEKLKHTEDEKERPAEETRRDEEYLQTLGKGVTSNSDVEMDSRQMQQPAALIPKVNKATLKEQKVLEKKVALRRKRKGDLRNLSQELALHEDRKRKREQPDEFDEMQIKTENKETVVASFASKDSKSTVPTDLSTNPVRRLSESIQSNDESRNELKMDHEPCRKQLRSNSFSQESVMKALEVTAVNDFEIEGNINSKDLPKQDDEVKHIKESDEEVVVCKSGLRTDNYQIDADQKLRDPSEEKAMSNCLYVIVAKSDNKTLVSSNSSDPSLIEQSQDAKSGENSKIKEEKCDEKGKEKIYDAESSLSKSRDNIQEDAKGHEKNKEKRNEAEGTRTKIQGKLTRRSKASEKGKQKLNDSENLRPKFKEITMKMLKAVRRSKEMKK